MNEKKIDEISKITEQRYTKRYNELGKNIKSLGWGSIKQQRFRFLQTLLSDLNFKEKKILDVGCGFGDYYSFLKDKKLGINHYTGWDINSNFINEAKNNFTSQDTSFYVRNVFKQKANEPVADIVVMFGLLNWKLSSISMNYDYTKRMVKKAYCLAGECLVVDFLSSNLSSDYPKEDFVFYHNPSIMLEFAFTLSDNVVLKHNYLPIPQKEFMLFIYK